jgi:hypothetical protein
MQHSCFGVEESNHRQRRRQTEKETINDRKAGKRAVEIARGEEPMLYVGESAFVRKQRVSVRVLVCACGSTRGKRTQAHKQNEREKGERESTGYRENERYTRPKGQARPVKMETQPEGNRREREKERTQEKE